MFSDFVLGALGRINMPAAFIIFISLCGVSCTHEDFSDCPPVSVAEYQVRFIHNWEDTSSGMPADGMRINLFATDGGSDYGRNDLLSDNVLITLPAERMYNGTTYSYFDSENVNFRNETNSEIIEAYARSLIRATYSRAFPDETTVMEPGSLFTCLVPGFTVAESTVVNLYPVNAVTTYTFEVRKVRGASGITDTRGAMSGISASYFLMTQALSDTVSSVMFDATANGDSDTITGSFTVFGLAGDLQTFSIEILYPSDTDGYVLLTWDVSSQLVTGGTHIIVEADIDIVPDSSTGAGFETSVSEWEDVFIPLDM